jgi:hypothetical protein
MPGWHRVELFVPAASFAVNGGLYGTLLSRYPELADHVGASEAGFGVALFAAAAGGLLGSVLAPALIRRVGELMATTLTACSYALVAVAVAAAPQLVLLAGAFLLLGLFDGSHDVSMNSLAVRAQQRLGESIMGRVHGTWSLLLAGAGAAGAAAAGAGLPVLVHVGAIAVLTVVLQLIVFVLGRRRDGGGLAPAGPVADDPGAAGAARWQRPDQDQAALGSTPTEAPAGDAAAAMATRTPRVTTSGRAVRRVFVVLGFAALAASFVESPGQEWTGLLLSRGFSSGTTAAAAAPVLFSTGLVISRLALDAGIRRFGASGIAVVAGLGIVLSMTAGLAAGLAGWSAPWAMAAITLAGLASGPVYPLLFGAADQVSVRFGIAPATTASVASMLSRIGAISAPLAVGALAQGLGLDVVFAVMLAGGAVLLVSLPRTVR